eukprot:scaffold13440_cov19-Tisochrysis_lutea.AAC.3
MEKSHQVSALAIAKGSSSHLSQSHVEQTVKRKLAMGPCSSLTGMYKSTERRQQRGKETRNRRSGQLVSSTLLGLCLGGPMQQFAAATKHETAHADMLMVQQCLGDACK